MFTRRAYDSRLLLGLVLLAFFAAVAWWWSLRAGRVDVNSAPTPTLGVPAAAPAVPQSTPSGPR